MFEALKTGRLWDWTLCQLSCDLGFDLLCLKDSAVQHIGYQGLNSGACHWDFCPNFGVPLNYNGKYTWYFYPCYDSPENDVCQRSDLDITNTKTPFTLQQLYCTISIVEKDYPEAAGFTCTGWVKIK